MRSKLQRFVSAWLLALLLIGNSALADVKYYGAFTEAAPTSISPQGWMKEILHRQVEGLGKHHAVSGYPYDTCLWAGKIPPDLNPKAKAWWPYEPAGYLVDGLERLGLATGDPTIQAEADANVHYILSHAQPDGSLGPDDIGPTNWPHAVVFRALMASYAAHPNEAIPRALARHYIERPTDFGAGRDVCNVEEMLWAYAHTGNSRLLEIAQRTYDNFNHTQAKTRLSELASDNKIIEHGVTFNETAKLPALLYLYTGDTSLLNASINAYRKIDRDHMLASGMHSAQEFLAGKDPWSLTETCDVTDYTWSVGYMLMATGDATYGDKIEKATFNAGLGAIAKDFKSHQYFSSPNQVIATHGICKAHNPDREAFRPGHDVECCSGNVHRMLPNYALRQWMLRPDGGVVAALYGASEFTTTLDGAKVRIDEQTDYPFSEDVRFVIHTDRPVEIPLSLRIPAWTLQPRIELNGAQLDDIAKPGTFAIIRRKFSDGDGITLHLPMTTKIVAWANQTASVERGPLVYSLKIDEDAKAVRGEKTSAEFPAWDKRPASPWNYALALPTSDSANVVKAISKPINGFPWDTKHAPIELRAPARKITNWSLAADGGNPGFANDPQFASTTETISLVPYGSTCLRLTVFPLCKAPSH
jgi:hypothetical protein